MWHLRRWLNGELCSAGSAVGLKDLRNLLQHKCFCNSISSAPPGIRPPALLFLPGAGTAITQVTSTPGDMSEAMGIWAVARASSKLQHGPPPWEPCSKTCSVKISLLPSFKLVWLNPDNFGYEL